MGKIEGEVTVLYVIDVPGVLCGGGGADDEGGVLHVSLQAGEDGVHLRALPVGTRALKEWRGGGRQVDISA
jgi:hypothetical protein